MTTRAIQFLVVFTGLFVTSGWGIALLVPSEGQPANAQAPASCEPATAKGARCRFIQAIKTGDPSALPGDDQEVFADNRDWLEGMRDYAWTAEHECSLEGDVTIICSASATPPNSAAPRIIDFTVQPVGENLDHTDGRTTGIEDYAVIAVGEFHQE